MNTCAVRLSYALNKSGVKIPNIPGKTKRGNIKSDGTYDYYFTFAKDLTHWMQKTFGTTSNPNYMYRDLDEYQGNENQYGEGFKKDILRKKGIYAMFPIDPGPQNLRSEERRVGKEWRSRRSP